jgi:hypothetical protein
LTVLATAAGDVATGTILVIVGIVLIVAGIAWGTDYRNLTSSFYRKTIQSWKRVPMLGDAYEQVTPFRGFRLTGYIVLIVMGAALGSLGVASLVIA